MSQSSASVRALVVVCAFAAQGAMAHTTLQAQATEATTSYNNVVIGHGCTVGGASVPVIAQSVVFPTVNPIVTLSGNVPATIAENGGYDSAEIVANLRAAHAHPITLHASSTARRVCASSISI